METTEQEAQVPLFPEQVTCTIPEPPQENFPPVLEIPENFDNIKSLDSNADISDEVAGAEAGSSFSIASGEYGEKIIIENDCNLIGTEDVKIGSSTGAPIITITSGNSIITSITFEQDEDSHPAISIEGGNVRFQNCIFKSSSEKASTVTIKNDTNVYFKNCQFLASSDEAAIECTDNSIVFCEDCDIQDSEEDLITLNGNSTFYIHNCSLSKAKGSAISINEHSRSIIQYTKFTNCEYGINIQSDAYHNITSLTFEEIEENCLFMTGNSSAQIQGTIFRSSSKPAIKLKKTAVLRLVQNSIIPGRWRAISLFDNSRIESFYDDIGGFVNIRSESTFVAVHSVLHLAGVRISDTGDFQCQDCTIQSIENGNPAIEANDESTLLLSGTQVAQTGGIRLRTTKRVHLFRTAVQECDTGIDIGGGTLIQITNCQIENSHHYGIFSHSATFTVNNSIVSQSALVGIQLVNSIATLNFNHIITNVKGGICLSDKSSLFVTDGIVNENNEFAILADSDSFVKITKAKLENNSNCGLIVTNSRANISDSEFNNNHGTACQFQGEKTKAVILRSNFIQNETGIINSEQSELLIDNCQLTENEIHIEGKMKSKTRISNKSVLSKSKKGVGIFIHDEALATIDDCVINNESKTAIVTSSATNVKNSQIENCGISGITYLDGSSGIIEHCQINFNYSAGINVSSPSVTIVDNTIKNNGKYGIAMKQNVKCDIGQNVLENNLTPYSVY